MTLDEAIKLLNFLILQGFGPTQDDTKDAVKLGIEALKRHRSLQANPYYTLLDLLPGETPPKPLHALGFNTGDDESP